MDHQHATECRVNIRIDIGNQKPPTVEAMCFNIRPPVKFFK